ncbi:MAG: beta-hydroxyacyl-ACP dehydratase [Bacteroidales bacterium]|nr:beta-hydroxyacyl-ACP dehydratase [Bacteroidales bacterium]
METPLYQGDSIKKLLLQREPILMVETLYTATEDEAETGLTVDADNIFCVDGELTEPGLIEHIAQSASAFASYKTSLDGNNEALLGYIGEVKKLTITGDLPRSGQEVRTTVKIQQVVGNITLFQVQTTVDGAPIANCQMKLSV